MRKEDSGGGRQVRKSIRNGRHWVYEGRKVGGQLRRPPVLGLKALGVTVMKKSRWRNGRKKGLCLWETDGIIQEIEQK